MGTITDAVHLLRSWWSVDRIRIFPDEGSLLRLQPPCYLRIAGQIIEIKSRESGKDDSGSYTHYRCLTGSGRCEIRVTPITSPPWAVVRWIQMGREQTLSVDDIEILGTTAS